MTEAEPPSLHYLLDSVIVIDHLNGHQSATGFILSYGPVIALSVITRAEVLAGTMPEFREPVLQLLNQFSTLPVTAAIADDAAELRRTERWKLPDAIQAAVTRAHNLVLVTRNSRDFRDGQPVRVLIPY
jgi:predicted nucleic acid-binding protein